MATPARRPTRFVSYEFSFVWAMQEKGAEEDERRTRRHRGGGGGGEEDGREGVPRGANGGRGGRTRHGVFRRLIDPIDPAETNEQQHCTHGFPKKIETREKA